MEDRWLSVDEIAAYLGIKWDTVYKWISEKKMPAHRMGRLWKFKKDEVDVWVKTGGLTTPKIKEKILNMTVLLDNKGHGKVGCSCS
jgi:excisionase family DNA binding protein